MENVLETPESYYRKAEKRSRPYGKGRHFHVHAEASRRSTEISFYYGVGECRRIHLVSFNEWWEILPQETRKNVRRSQKRVW